MYATDRIFNEAFIAAMVLYQGFVVMIEAISLS